MAEDNPKDAKAKASKAKGQSGQMFSLKKWNAVAMWQWDVECDTCAICRVQVMGECMLTDSRNLPPMRTWFLG